MKNIETEQRRMRERNRKAELKSAVVRPDSVDDTSELLALRKRVKELEAETARLRLQVASLSRQTSRVQEKSPDDQRREQQHNYFKYSNARRY